jgi:hypothetical protein
VEQKPVAICRLKRVAADERDEDRLHRCGLRFADGRE